MKAKFKYIHFEDISYMYPGRKTKTFSCQNNNTDTPLGDIQWENSWRQYCFYPKDQIVLAASCLVDINYFIAHLNKEHKK